MESIVGKTIVGVSKARHPYLDDEGFVIITFSDGTKCTIVSSYHRSSYNSFDEYPTDIHICCHEYVVDDSTTNFAGNDALLPLIPLDKSAYGACRYKKQILSIALQQEIRAAYIERQSRPDGEIS